MQDRLFHLAWLGEELPTIAAQRDGGWIYRQIAREAAAVLAVATEYMSEHELARVFMDARGTLSAVSPGEQSRDAVRAAWQDTEESISASWVPTQRTPEVPLRVDGDR
ncbi:hypothetical protein SAMN05660733_02523 [Lentzea albidocapillata]|uniref:Uncharacterized protein n=2 Tax=Lentzea albidocapillata TaxID=40571 RepID=A0A1W2CZ56_9PSEU|nr:hypothetical protein SAMN05660733_02523 [Lentzea albidocapillata]